MPTNPDIEFLRQLLVELVANRLDKLDESLTKVLNKIEDHESRLNRIEAGKQAIKENSLDRARILSMTYDALACISTGYIILHVIGIIK